MINWPNFFGVPCALHRLFHSSEFGGGVADMGYQRGLGILHLAFAAGDLPTLEIAHAVGIVVPVFTRYIGHKRWSFR